MPDFKNMANPKYVPVLWSLLLGLCSVNFALFLSFRLSPKHRTHSCMEVVSAPQLHILHQAPHQMESIIIRRSQPTGALLEWHQAPFEMEKTELMEMELEKRRHIHRQRRHRRSMVHR